MIYRYIIQSEYNRLKPEKNITGSWHGGTFYAQPFLPIELKIKNVQLQKQIKNYNKCISFLYLNVLVLITALVLLNIGD